MKDSLNLNKKSKLIVVATFFSPLSFVLLFWLPKGKSKSEEPHSKRENLKLCEYINIYIYIGLSWPNKQIGYWVVIHIN